MPERPNADLPRRERATPEELRDWETLQDDGGAEKTQRLAVLGGFLYRTRTAVGVAMVFVPNAAETA